MKTRRRTSETAAIVRHCCVPSLAVRPISRTKPSVKTKEFYSETGAPARAAWPRVSRISLLHYTQLTTTRTTRYDDALSNWFYRRRRSIILQAMFARISLVTQRAHRAVCVSCRTCAFRAAQCTCCCIVLSNLHACACVCVSLYNYNKPHTCAFDNLRTRRRSASKRRFVLKQTLALA